MHGAIHGIWLTTKDGNLHPAITPNLTAWVKEAAAADFAVVLWTNLSEINQREIKTLRDAGVIVEDHSKCKNSVFYKYFDYFFQKGLQGDKTAFALASDVLRMTVLDFTPDDKYFIYVDANDTTLNHLRTDLTNIDTFMAANSFGYSYRFAPSNNNPDEFHVRNDVLIGLKSKNPEFFKAYLYTYWKHLEHTYSMYKSPADNTQALNLANIITNQTTDAYFLAYRSKDNEVHVVTKFGNFTELGRIVNSDLYLSSSHEFANSGTWFPITLQNDAKNMFSQKNNIQDGDVFVRDKPQQNYYRVFDVDAYSYFTATNIASIAVIIVLATMFSILRSKKRYSLF